MMTGLRRKTYLGLPKVPRVNLAPIGADHDNSRADMLPLLVIQITLLGLEMSMDRDGLELFSPNLRLSWFSRKPIFRMIFNQFEKSYHRSALYRWRLRELRCSAENPVPPAKFTR